MNTNDLGRLETIKNRLEKIVNANLNNDSFTVTYEVGFLQGFVESWVKREQAKLDVQDSKIETTDPEIDLSGCCEAPITETGFCTECKDNA